MAQAWCSLAWSRKFLQRNHGAQIDDAISIVFEQGAGQVFANRVHVLVDRTHDHGALILDAGVNVGAGLIAHVGFEEGHRLAHHVGRLEQMRQGDFAPSEPVAQFLHRAHQVLVDEIERGMAFHGLRHLQRNRVRVFVGMPLKLESSGFTLLESILDLFRNRGFEV